MSDTTICACGHGWNAHSGAGHKPGETWCCARASGDRAKPWTSICNCVAFTAPAVPAPRGGQERASAASDPAGNPADAARLAEIEKRLARSTPSPWRIHEDDARTLTIRARGPIVSGVVASIHTAWPHRSQQSEQGWNAELIAFAPDDLRWLIEQLRSAERNAKASPAVRSASLGEDVTDEEVARAVIGFPGLISRSDMQLVLEQFLDGRRQRSGCAPYFAAPASAAEREAFAQRLEAFEPDPTGGGGNCEIHGDEYSTDCDVCTGHIVQADIDLVRRVAQTKEPELHRVADRLTAMLVYEAAERSEAIESIRRGPPSPAPAPETPCSWCAAEMERLTNDPDFEGRGGDLGEGHFRNCPDRPAPAPTEESPDA